MWNKRKIAWGSLHLAQFQGGHVYCMRHIASNIVMSQWNCLLTFLIYIVMTSSTCLFFNIYVQLCLLELDRETIKTLLSAVLTEGSKKKQRKTLLSSKLWYIYWKYIKYCPFVRCTFRKFILKPYSCICQIQATLLS